MSNSRAGIHLDGTSAAVAVVHGDRFRPAVELVQVVHAGTPTAALAAAAALVTPGLPVRVSVSTTGVAGTAVEVTAAQLTRRGFTRTARQRLGQPTALVAGRVGDLDLVTGGRMVPGFAVTAPADLVSDAYLTLGARHPVEVVTAASVHYADGLHLAIRRASVELTLVDDRMPRATRVLGAGGVDTVVANLAGDTRRAGATLTGQVVDPLATATLRHWLSELLAEVNRTRSGWLREGHNPPSAVMVSGIGAEAHHLTGLLAEHGLSRASHPDLSRLPHTTPHQVLEAYLAAVSAGADMPYVALPDPAAGPASVPVWRRAAGRVASLAGADTGALPATEAAAVLERAADLLAGGHDRHAAFEMAAERDPAGRGQAAGAALRTGTGLAEALTASGLVPAFAYPALDAVGERADQPAALRRVADGLRAHARVRSSARSVTGSVAALAALAVVCVAAWLAGAAGWPWAVSALSAGAGAGRLVAARVPSSPVTAAAHEQLWTATARDVLVEGGDWEQARTGGRVVADALLGPHRLSSSVEQACAAGAASGSLPEALARTADAAGRSVEDAIAARAVAASRWLVAVAGTVAVCLPAVSAVLSRW